MIECASPCQGFHLNITGKSDKSVTSYKVANFIPADRPVHVMFDFATAYLPCIDFPEKCIFLLTIIYYVSMLLKLSCSISLSWLPCFIDYIPLSLELYPRVD